MELICSTFEINHLNLVEHWESIQGRAVTIYDLIQVSKNIEIFEKVAWTKFLE